MPLVFVHGVNNRRGDIPKSQDAYDTRLKLISEQLGQITFRGRVTAPDGCRTFEPYWGDLGVKFARNLACIPHSTVQELAVGDEVMRPALEVAAAQLDATLLQSPAQRQSLQDAPLLTVARARSLVAAIDLLMGVAATAPFPVDLLGEAGVADAVHRGPLVALELIRYAEANPALEWLQDASLQSDDVFLGKLLSEAEAFVAAHPTNGGSIQSLGLGDAVQGWLENAVNATRDAVGRVATAAGNAIQGTAVASTRGAFLRIAEQVRPTASTFIGRFFGDVFTYLENREPIIDRVLGAVRQADAARRAGDSELYLIGHSFGGIILYDILTHFARDLECDVFVTAGSQVALFAEMGRLADATGIQSGLSDGDLGLPSTVKRWINIYDSTDLVGFGTIGVFAQHEKKADGTHISGVEEFRFETDAFPIVSHGAYFDTPRFYVRLHEHL